MLHVHYDLEDIDSRSMAYKQAPDHERLAVRAELTRRASDAATNAVVAMTSALLVATVAFLSIAGEAERRLSEGSSSVAASADFSLGVAQLYASIGEEELAIEQLGLALDQAELATGALSSSAEQLVLYNMLLLLLPFLGLLIVGLWLYHRSRLAATAQGWLLIYQELEREIADESVREATPCRTSWSNGWRSILTTRREGRRGQR